MNYKLTILPAIEVGHKYMELLFETSAEMVASSNACADLLLFLQDKLKVMPDHSNIFTMEELVDGEWLEYEEE